MGNQDMSWRRGALAMFRKDLVELPMWRDMKFKDVLDNCLTSDDLDDLLDVYILLGTDVSDS